MTITRYVATSYQHIQAEPSTTWVISHYLGYYPIVDTFIDVAGDKFKAIPLEVVYDTPNQCTVSFTEAQTGIALVA